MGNNYVGSEHLVLAIVRLADPTLSGLLQQHTLSTAVERVDLELLRS